MRRRRFRKCKHCKKNYIPDARNVYHQRYCGARECRRVSKAQSQQHWLCKPGNQDHFRGGESTERVREWRLAHPGYHRSRRKKGNRVQQDLCSAKDIDSQTLADLKHEASSVVQQDLLIGQSTLVVGLVSHLVGSVQQEIIVPALNGFISKGRAVLGQSALRPPYDQTYPPTGTAPADPAPVQLA